MANCNNYLLKKNTLKYTATNTVINMVPAIHKICGFVSLKYLITKTTKEHIPTVTMLAIIDFNQFIFILSL